MTSPFDQFSALLAPAMRQLSDNKVRHLGTEVDVLRIARTEIDDFGETEPSLETTMLTKCIIKYPFNAMEIFSTKKDGSQESTLDAIDLMDLLPIELHLQFKGLDSIDKYIEPVDLNIGDYIVDHLRDEENTIIPIVLQVERFRGGFKSKYIVKKYAEMSLVRGEYEQDISDSIDNYLSGLI